MFKRLLSHKRRKTMQRVVNDANPQRSPERTTSAHDGVHTAPPRPDVSLPTSAETHADDSPASSMPRDLPESLKTRLPIRLLDEHASLRNACSIMNTCRNKFTALQCASNDSTDALLRMQYLVVDFRNAVPDFNVSLWTTWNAFKGAEVAHQRSRPNWTRNLTSNPVYTTSPTPDIASFLDLGRARREYETVFGRQRQWEGDGVLHMSDAELAAWYDAFDSEPDRGEASWWRAAPDERARLARKLRSKIQSQLSYHNSRGAYLEEYRTELELLNGFATELYSNMQDDCARGSLLFAWNHSSYDIRGNFKGRTGIDQLPNREVRQNIE